MSGEDLVQATSPAGQYTITSTTRTQEEVNEMVAGQQCVIAQGCGKHAGER